LRLALAFGVLPALACTTWPSRFEQAKISADDLLAGKTLGVPAEAPALTSEVEVLALTPEMRAFLNTHVDRRASPKLKLYQLSAAIQSTETFGVTYTETTRTASDTFRSRRGNCLSFSNLFVAMARDVGLSAEFQEVEVPPDWTFDNETYVLNRHINVYVDLGQSGTRVVDFNIGDYRSSYEARRIPDARALAHFYNNIGVERMQAGDTAAALACFRRAILASGREFSPAWTNLGTLYLRHDDLAHAEAAYLQALAVNDDDFVAMSNLARLYGRRGDVERADAYRKRVARHRWLNPYYRFELARRAYAAHDYDVAIGHLKYAFHQRPKEDQFCELLARCYLGKGDAREARYWLMQAQEVAATDALKRRYSSEIDTLLRSGQNSN
jgi:Flp pilus assembly protein TadD